MTCKYIFVLSSCCSKFNSGNRMHQCTKRISQRDLRLRSRGLTGGGSMTACVRSVQLAPRNVHQPVLTTHWPCPVHVIPRGVATSRGETGQPGRLSFGTDQSRLVSYIGAFVAVELSLNLINKQTPNPNGRPGSSVLQPINLRSVDFSITDYPQYNAQCYK